MYKSNFVHTDINRVTLVGSIVGADIKNDRGAKYFNVRTTSDDDKRE